MDLENSHVIDRKLRKIEDKFEYVNMICLDLNNLLTSQSDCIKTLDTNYGKTLENTTKAKLELVKLQEYKETNSKRNCVVFLALGVIGILTYFIMSLGIKFNYQAIH
jgi:hypothetical protein